MSLVLSSVREDLPPAVLMDVENFFCKIQAVFLDWSLPAHFSRSLWPFCQRNASFEAWAISEQEEGSRVAMIEALG